MDKTLKQSPNMAMSDRQHAEHTAASWIAKRDAGPWTGEDAATFDAWLSASASNRAAYYRLNGAWQEAGRLKALMGARTAGAVENVESSDGAGGFRKLYLAIAAGVLLLVGAASFVPQ